MSERDDQFLHKTSGLGEMIGHDQVSMIEASYDDDTGAGGGPAIGGERTAAHPADRAALRLDIGMHRALWVSSNLAPRTAWREPMIVR